MTSNSPLRAALAATLLGGVWLFAQPTFAQEEVCAPPTVVDQPPPPLPDYEQPPLPASGYIWSPGYWAYDSDESDYYWVPGTWAQPPRSGLLWTPGYWAWVAGAYVFHAGYWGPRVGFYGGINYGYGYGGDGYGGGRWDHGAFFYNRTVNNFGAVAIRNVYEQRIVVNNTVNNISFNGGKGGVEAQPTPEDRAYARQAHFAPTPLQRQHVEAASKDPALFQKTNHGAPAIAATPRPAEFKGPGVAPARVEGAPAGANPATEEKKPEREEKKPPLGGAQQQEKRLTAPAAESPAPAEPKKLIIEEKKPAEESRPKIEEKRPGPPKPQPEIRPEPMRPKPPAAGPEPMRPQPQAVRPERARTAPAAHPPGKPEGKEKKQP